ncbi:MAG: recombinase family protein [Lachnospirales bacterium]
MAKEKQIKVIRSLSELQDTIPKLKVCTYCRVSTDYEEQESSYETQQKYYKELIENNSEWEFVRIYADKGSGKTITNRPEFNKMLEDCEDGVYDKLKVP